MLGGQFAALVRDDILRRGVSREDKINDIYGDAVERTAGLLWMSGDAEALVTLAWLSACVETQRSWADPPAQQAFEVMQRVGHYTTTVMKGNLHAAARRGNAAPVLCLFANSLPAFEVVIPRRWRMQGAPTAGAGWRYATGEATSTSGWRYAEGGTEQATLQP